MYKIIALLRSSWVAAASYRMSTVISLVGLLLSVVPLYFVTEALQPTMAESIRGQGEHYFGFVIVGMVAFWFLTVAISSLPGVIASGISNGTLEAMLGTPTRLPTLLAGLISYQFMWVCLRAAVLLVVGAILGAHLAWDRLALGGAILALIVLAYLPIGLIAAALILAFRTAGPLTKGVLVLSTLMGGVYYPTHVIPAWLESISAFIPLTYGLRALRGAILEGASLDAVAGDVAILSAFVVGLFALGSWALLTSLRYARRAGTLAQY